MNFKKSKHGKAVSRPLVGRNKADYEVTPHTTRNTDEDIRRTLLTSLKDALPNACVFKGMQSTDDPSELPMEQEETTPVIVYNAENYYIENMINNRVDHISEAEVQAVNKATLGQSSNP
ncbi:uncharacterized protein LOC134245416 [Saccostrea cucullata]|uniref:uncharacterized protein LOC134245416 n=1 Tax=Saccostrea cuccullata TaxID=36930 RepID=UPI002ED557C7